jgi:hypothetical protein
MPDENRSEMSARTMALLGAGGAVLVAVVLGASLVFRGGGGAETPASSAPVSVAPASAVAVPQLAGLDRAEAARLLAERRLEVAAVIQVPSALHAGQVVRTYPAAGTSVSPGTGVTLYVSPR